MFEQSQTDTLPDVFVTPHEYTMVSAKLAHVTASVSSECSQSDLLGYLGDAFGPGVTPVRGSFRWIDDTKSAVVGFVYAPTRVEHCPGGKVAANFRVTAGYMYMDDKDKSLWEMKEGVGGKYLLRKGQDDLTAMLEQARTSPRGSQPRMASVQRASLAKPTVQVQQIVAFVSEGRRTSEMDYGINLGSKGDSVLVLSHLTSETAVVPRSHIVASHDIEMAHVPPLPKEKVEAIKKAKFATASKVEKAADVYTPKLTPQEYWTLQYSYAPDYLEQVLKQVNEMAAA